MKRLEIKGLEEKRIWAHRTKGPLKDFHFKSKFLCMTIGLSKLSEKNLQEIAKNLLKNDCIYTVSAGEQSNDMELQVDFAYINEIENKKYKGKPPESAFVLTSSHADDSMEDALFFFFSCAHTTNQKGNLYEDYLILFLGDNQAKEKLWMDKIKDYPKYMEKLK